MSDRLLFWIPTLIWATTWHAILYQLGETSALHSVALRFGLASAMLFAIAHWRGELTAQWPRLHGWLFFTGAVQYGFNYLCTYESEKHLASGLVAVLFSLMIFTNAIGGAICFGQALTRRFLWSGVIGVVGVALIFWPDIAAASAAPGVLLGVGLAMSAVLLASAGNMLTLKLTRQGVPLVPLLAWTMGYGSATLLLVATVSGVKFRWDSDPSYWLSLLYLSAFGSVTAFLLYFKLAQRQGAGRAALVGLVIPAIALVVSAVFENWRPTVVSALGIVLCLAGLWGATRPDSTPAIDPKV
ncbi:MAG: DMT family transporter [Rhodoferax sp.]|nr:DMT family transporter [Rhodoferax sp.]MCF8212014.1 DMT family transporter [Rhodoferax sp.]